MNKIEEIKNRLQQLNDDLKHAQSAVIEIEYEIEDLENELERQINHENGDDIIIGDCKDGN